MGSDNPTEAETAKYSILWIGCPEYPCHRQLPPRLFAAIEAFLAAGKGVFAEFTIVPHARPVC